MGLSVILMALLLLQSALSLTDDSFEGYEIFGPDEEADMEPYMDRQSRGNDKFLRFGKAFWDYESGNEAPYSDKADQRPPRTGSLPDNPQQRSARDKSSFLRFGRSISEGSKKKRDKRQAAASADALKRHENYLRFGRTASSNFMRFGRNLGAQGGLSEEELIRPSLESRNRHLLDYLKSLLRQSDGRISHLN
ncbi:FMRFamide-related neuropeptides [Dendroctonus ponderosae]|uniref:Uncharacterized protein n=1 Tax=Dendroctonus ponderosae TaxID=77166 RepID=A0AAR5NYM5_DENPD|nr:FMRFamide-related neuropeptides [Dendroctonus ponderosae]